jgi:hypothetical protein
MVAESQFREQAAHKSGPPETLSIRIYRGQIQLPNTNSRLNIGNGFIADR